MVSQELLGFLATLGAAFGYGSSYVPVRSHEVYDGLIFNWYQSIGLLIAGVTVALFHNDWSAPTGSSPSFYVHREGLVCGIIYQVGNILATQAVKRVGLGVYYTVHEFTNVGATLIIGFLGPSMNIPVSVPKNVSLALGGAFLMFLGMIPTMLMKDPPAEVEVPTEPASKSEGRRSLDDLFVPLKEPVSASPSMFELNARTCDGSSYPAAFGKVALQFHRTTSGLPTMPVFDGEEEEEEEVRNWEAQISSEVVEKKTTGSDKVVGLTLTLAAGFVFGVMFSPMPIWKLRMKEAGLEPDPANFVFAACVGSVFSSTAWLLFWSTIKKVRKQKLDKSVLRPALAAGVIFYIGMLLEFYAIAMLPYAIAYTGCTGLSLAASMSWGIFAFGEMKGARNRILAALSFFGVLSGAACLALAA